MGGIYTLDLVSLGVGRLGTYPSFDAACAAAEEWADTGGPLEDWDELLGRFAEESLPGADRVWIADYYAVAFQIGYYPAGRRPGG